MEDPFDEIRDEVEKGLSYCERALRDTSPTGGGEVEEVVVQVKVDLRDLGEAVKVVEKAPARFGVTPWEVEERGAWVAAAERRLHKITTHNEKEDVDGPLIDDDSADSQDPDNMLREHFATLDSKNQGQDHHLRRLDAAVLRQKSTAEGINDELDAQSKLLATLEGKIDTVTGRLVKLSAKMDVVINETSNTKKIALIVVLTLVLMLLIVLTFT